jgi:hypothetical protein
VDTRIKPKQSFLPRKGNDHYSVRHFSPLRSGPASYNCE